MPRKQIDDLRDYLVGAAQDFPGALRASVDEDERGVFSVEMEDGTELIVAIAAVVI